MLDSARTIFNQYIDVAPRFKMRSIEMSRGDNPEDAFYLCNVNDDWYVVYETDYIVSLPAVASEAEQLFSGFRAQSGRWLTKKDFVDNKVPSHEIFIFKPQDSYLRYAVLEVSTDRPVSKTYNPTTYGHSN